MALIKTAEEIERLRKAGRVLARILREVKEYTEPGMSTQDVNDKAAELAEEYGAEPVLLGYHPDFADIPYPAAMCTSRNNTVQHGIPREDEILEKGDILNIDMSIAYEGMIVDSGLTFPIGGETDAESQRLIDVTKEARKRGIAAAKVGNRVGDIGHAIEEYVASQGFGLVEVLCGHGVGHAVHEDPQVPNFGKPGTGPALQAGMVLAIEPIVNIGDKDVWFDDDGDGYSVYTCDKSRSAHFEHTVAITEKGPEIMTQE